MKNAEKVTFHDRFENCPGCGYTGGFHIILLKAPSATPAEMKFDLKCPSCSRTYDLDLFCVCRK